jgi:hypothetical protein
MGDRKIPSSFCLLANVSEIPDPWFWFEVLIFDLITTRRLSENSGFEKIRREKWESGTTFFILGQAPRCCFRNGTV